MSFGKALRGKREALGLSLRALARAVEVDPAHLSRVEQGTTPPSTHLLDGLHAPLGLSRDELYLMAGKLPESLQRLVEREPYRVASALTGLAEMVVAEPRQSYGVAPLATHGPSAIEDGFPFEQLSDVAEVESWRKEVYRPVYHQHKWWAQRLGSVFRAAILGAATPKGSSIMELFHQPVKLGAPVIFDPFMGSGTTIGEAHKLGCTVIGRDINPVAYRCAKASLERVSRARVISLFAELEDSVGATLGKLYEGLDSRGEKCSVLYFFWVKYLPCPGCNADVELFGSRIFASHAYPKRFPEVQVSCPGCGDVFESTYTASETRCPSCKLTFDPQTGPARGAGCRCSQCGTEFQIARTAKALGRPPEHRMYAKLVLRRDGSKEYLRIDEHDRRLFESARKRLRELAPRLPDTRIAAGYNTKQVLNYGYTTWDQMFNERQLLGLTLLARGICALPAGSERDALMLLFSGVLEFNNMFASYKGEGTGAVRHMFSHHVLKPERTPLEANIWGTPKSSGSFSTLFKSRLLRALEYKDAPFEVAVTRRDGKLSGSKVFGLSAPMGAVVVSKYPEGGLQPAAAYLSCGDSANTDLPSRSVDYVVTDPPFFDNVHYSELADFFYAWQRIYFTEDGASSRATTRRPEEVQDTDAGSFSAKLRSVFEECHRVLKPDGLLVFSYHHSRDDGWSSVAQSVIGAGFTFVQAQPVKAEMSVATPKLAAKSPIDLDVLLVCRKAVDDTRSSATEDQALENAVEESRRKVLRFGRSGRALSKNDVRVVLISQVLVELSAGRPCAEVLEAVSRVMPQVESLASNLFEQQSTVKQLDSVGRTGLLFGYEDEPSRETSASGQRGV